MENSNNLGAILFLIVLVILWVKMIDSQNRRDMEGKAYAQKRETDEKRKKQEAIDTELQFVTTAYQALPDLKDAFSTLRSQYKWDAITFTIGISSVDLELLRRIPCDEPDTIELPNLQSLNYNSDEKRILAKIREIIRNLESGNLEVGGKRVSLLSTQVVMEWIYRENREKNSFELKITWANSASEIKEKKRRQQPG